MKNSTIVEQKKSMSSIFGMTINMIFDEKLTDFGCFWGIFGHFVAIWTLFTPTYIAHAKLKL